MPTLRALLSATVACVVLGPATPAATAAPKPSLLFVQQTDSGTLKRTGPSTYLLTLRGVAPSVSTFTDRPARSAASESARQFVTRWAPRGFSTDPPNAALTIDGAPNSRDVAMLTLSHPHYHPKARTFTYVARELKGAPGGALKTFHARRDRVRELRFDSASLFIDDAAANMVQQLQITFTPVHDDAVYSLEIPAGSGVSFVPSTPGQPAISLMDNAMTDTPPTSTVTPNSVSFTAKPVPGASQLDVWITIVSEPNVIEFPIRNTSSADVYAFWYLDYTSDDEAVINRTFTTIAPNSLLQDIG